MPPKATASAPEGQRSKDAMYIFDNLFEVISPVVFNIAEIAEKTGAKANTLQKRFSIIRSRYPGLNIQTTVTGGAGNGASGSGAGGVPATPKAVRKTPAKATATKSKARKPAEDDADDADADADGNEIKAEDVEEDSADAETNSIQPAKAKGVAKPGQTPTTPVGVNTDVEHADDEKSTKKQAAKPTVSKAKAKPKAQAKANNNANTAAKRKRPTANADDDSPTPAPVAKKPKVTKSKQVQKPKKSKVKVESDEEKESEADELGKQASHQEVSHMDADNSVNAKANTEAVTQVQDNADLALDVVQHYADKSQRGAIIMASTTTPAPSMARSGEDQGDQKTREDVEEEGEEYTDAQATQVVSGVEHQPQSPTINTNMDSKPNEPTNLPNRPDEPTSPSAPVDTDFGFDFAGASEEGTQA